MIGQYIFGDVLVVTDGKFQKQSIDIPHYTKLRAKGTVCLWFTCDMMCIA